LDIDPLEIAGGDEDEQPASSMSEADKQKSKLNSLVAITVALLATFMGLCAIKGDNVGQAMQAAQTEKIDNWGFYQARNIREEIMNATAASLEAQSAAQTGPAKQAFITVAKQYRDMAKAQETKKAEPEKLAREAEEDYEKLNHRDDQMDLSDATISIAIALLALTALTSKRWLYGIALIPAGIGVMLGMAGLLGLNWMPLGFVAKWLGA
jgi:hypothetical protein